MDKVYTYEQLLDEVGNVSKTDRLAYIDFLLMFKGSLTRQDLTDFFGIKVASASAAISDYREYRQDNVEYVHKEAKNVIKFSSFNPLLNYDAENALGMLANGFNKGKFNVTPTLPYERVGFMPKKLDVNLVAKVTRAISNKSAIVCKYLSHSSKVHDDRTLYPTAIFYDGISWMFRAFSISDSTPDGDFRSFNFSRVSSVTEAPQSFAKRHQTIQSDADWQTIIPVILEIHPSIHNDFKKKSVLIHEYGVDSSTNQLSVSVRAVLFYYLKEQWSIDVRSEEEIKADKRGSRYNFILKNSSMFRHLKCMEHVFKPYS
ncbi:WYL domain-containing protein [Rheinheimera maricola]|uniref:WYL domain-containing protein n=1 Tax=Rheinheimera maricola TaxID=2793282 RepID=A0ABS7X9W1_9GAMM|nr:WYL domain-containing protein [Rheinheimera maricola]MBZ9612331.1 WYL domain-containing protein [Rheinheimera maricola]